MILPKLTIGDLTADIPIVQGAMGIGVSNSKLAAAVANEGGIGVIAGVNIGYQEPDFETNNIAANIRGLKKSIRDARENSKGIIGVNFMVAMNKYKELVKTAVEEKIDLIVSGAGLPSELPAFVGDSPTKLVPIVSSAKAANVIAKVWSRKYNRVPDAVVLEGVEAGGHLGFKLDEITGNKFDIYKTLYEIKTVLKTYEEKFSKKIPVIVAGGIYSGSDIVEAIRNGADAVQMATRFVATEECDASDAFKQAYVNARKEDVRIIKSPVGMPGRAINNKFLERLDREGRLVMDKCYDCLRTCQPKTTPYCISEALINAVNGDLDNGLIFAGSNVYKVKEITTVKKLFRELLDEIEAL